MEKMNTICYFVFISLTILCLEKREISTVSEFDKIRRGSWILRDDSNGEVRFVIRDLEKFWTFTEMTILPFFRKLEFFRVLYDYMLHFNQVMILSAGNDCLLCKVFPAILKGPALAWFHKLLRGSINSFSELWAAFIFQYLCLVRKKGNISSLQTIFKWEDESIWDFTRRFGQAVQQIDAYNIDAVL